MTNTKFRKRALLSSVAMLLVALVALGSATFAWFVANPTVYATGLTMQAVSAPGLYVASDSKIAADVETATTGLTDADEIAAATAEATLSAYGMTTTLSASTFKLLPASPAANAASFTNGALAFAEIEALNADDEAKNAADTFSAVTPYTFSTADPDNHVYYEDIYLKTSTTAADDTAKVRSFSVKITTSNHAAAKGIKVALVTSDGVLLGIWKPTTGTATQVWAGATDNSTTAAFTGTYYDSEGVKDLGLNNEWTIGSAVKGSGSEKFIRAYVYLDGENNDVQSSLVPTIATLVSEISVGVSTKATFTFPTT